MSTIDGRLARILDKQGREFHLRLKPTRDSANAIFYTNVGKCETQGRIQEESATSTVLFFSDDSFIQWEVADIYRPSQGP
jgi:hypothetical protein